MHLQAVLPTVGATLALLQCSHAIIINVNNTQSMTTASRSIAAQILAIYHNTSTVPGVFSDPYYWWESGLAWDSLINYWALTGDSSYNDIVREGLLYQIGPNSDFTPPNQTKSEGNDDQSTWALAAMTAAEHGFPKASGGANRTYPTWLQLAQNVFNSQAARWDNSTCNGGLRWQVYTFNNGYNYKQALSNGNFFQLAARLARYTGNQTYLDWARSTLEWSYGVGMISTANGSAGAIWDGTDTTTNCSQWNHLQWTSNAGTFLSGSSYAVNYVRNTTYWNVFPFSFFVNANSTFANNDNILTEIACAPSNTCNTDQLAFRAILARGLATARDLTLDTTIRRQSPNGTASTVLGTLHGLVNRILQASAQGAALQCSNSTSGSICGSDWTRSSWDGTQGLGQQLSALEILLANLPARPLLDINSTAPATVGGNATAANGTATSTNASTTTPSGSAPATFSGAATSAYESSAFALLGCASLVVAWLL
ncbi:glycoside hydrolase family 76 protein [Baudoinia panamericana UAMH 10762]|uniref:Mannan endo-1,6-alpha-mannosidase n=1 Tax=Baudoinia panamericana (strain UAMH 10762) TaxID=717646 RepID=M2M7R1_BAUPA|nr:glycoside hydrolase family 76 protein [Baudoinia panamericana UAMH 10762]EMC92366.1 glycoside hydrolase family 76 protein [Baudoinia panamericana UAMH 10762]